MYVQVCPINLRWGTTSGNDTYITVRPLMEIVRSRYSWNRRFTGRMPCRLNSLPARLSAPCRLHPDPAAWNTHQQRGKKSGMQPTCTAASTHHAD